MYESHPNFIQPDNENIKVWRYLDFTKLISLFDKRRLYFSRADRFNDPFEGSLPQRNIESRKIAPNDIPDHEKNTFIDQMNQMAEIYNAMPKQMAINCWHANEYESAAMWNLYLKSDEGIAIQSTFSKLKKSIIDEEVVYIGKVKYIDYESDYFDASNVFEAFVHKRKSFEYENEIRAVIAKFAINGNPNTYIANGIEVKVDIETLIENIHIAPNAPTWFLELVVNVIKRYGYNFNVRQSFLNRTPLF